MKKSTSNYRHDGLSAMGYEEAYALGLDHYKDLLSQAEQQRLERRIARDAASGQPTRTKSPIYRLLTWVGLF